MNRLRKGRRIEAAAVAILRHHGFIVHRTRRSTYRRGGRTRSGGNDVFRCIDIIAKPTSTATDSPSGRTLWIQCTADRGIGKKRRDLAGVPWNTRHDQVEIWRYVSRRGPRRRQNTDGRPLRSYFQIYCLDDDYTLRPESRAFPPGKRGKP